MAGGGGAISGRIATRSAVTTAEKTAAAFTAITADSIATSGRQGRTSATTGTAETVNRIPAGAALTADCRAPFREGVPAVTTGGAVYPIRTIATKCNPTFGGYRQTPFTARARTGRSVHTAISTGRRATLAGGIPSVTTLAVIDCTGSAVTTFAADSNSAGGSRGLAAVTPVATDVVRRRSARTTRTAGCRTTFG